MSTDTETLVDMLEQAMPCQTLWDLAEAYGITEDARP